MNTRKIKKLITNVISLTDAGHIQWKRVGIGFTYVSSCKYMTHLPLVLSYSAICEVPFLSVDDIDVTPNRNDYHIELMALAESVKKVAKECNYETIETDRESVSDILYAWMDYAAKTMLPE